MKTNGKKNYFLTFFDKEEVELLKTDNIKYAVIGREITPTTNVEHWHAYAEFKSTKLFKTIKNRYKTVNVREDTKFDNRDKAIEYCKKDGDWIEIGENEKKEPGKRTDLFKIRDRIIAGEKVDDIAIENPLIYHMYGRTMHKIEDIKMRKNKRLEKTECIWFHGKTGSGKSEMAFMMAGDDYYVWSSEHWQDGYTGQKTVILDDFRGNIPYNELLKMTDVHDNFYVYRRGRERLPFTSKMVIITSALEPKDVYHNLSINDSLDQLLRRIKIVRVGGTEEVILDSSDTPETEPPWL